MTIKHTFTGMLSGQKKVVMNCDMTSPSTGYTQAHADRAGKYYENGRAEELLGTSDYWEWTSSEYVR